MILPGRASEESEALLRRATTAFQARDTHQAIALAGQAIAEDPKDYRAHFVRGRFHAELGRHEKAIQDYNAALQAETSEGSIYHHRGVEHFKLGRMEKAIDDFDRYLERAPAQKPHHWQRGIACYYAGQFDEGRRQFELHQTVNRHDVENAVWHYLCVARAENPDVAREKLIPIRGDARVPMKEVHDLFAGQGTTEQVLAAAQSGRPSEAALQRNLFYAHLYLGLYYEAIRNDPLARRHIVKASELSDQQNYMGAVARVHAARFNKSPAAKTPAKEEDSAPESRLEK